MLANALAALNQRLAPATEVSAHCDGPCGVYDPASVRIAAEAAVSMTKKILALEPPRGDDPAAWAAYLNTLGRYVAIKEEQAHIAKTELPCAGAREALLWALRRRRRFVVRGRSMLPTLDDGTTVLADPGARPAVGDIIVARHPHRRGLLLIKRIAALDSEGRASLTGDNPSESTHSFGAVRPELVMGVVRSRILV